VNAENFGRPVPVVDGDSSSYWAAAHRGELLINRCARCEQFVFYRRSVCPHCGAAGVEPYVAKGTGTVYSYTISRRPASPEFRDDVPYVVALVELDEGVRLMTNIVNCEPAAVYIGQAVSVRFESIAEDISLPFFEPVDSRGGEIAAVGSTPTSPGLTR
jgi:uncharacterized OB-fold protein